MALNLTKAVLDCLKARHEEKLTARQIAEWIFSTYPSECQEKKSNSQGGYIKTDGDLVQQLVAEIGSRRPSLQKQCQTAWKNGQGIRENSVENCLP